MTVLKRMFSPGKIVPRKPIGRLHGIAKTCVVCGWLCVMFSRKTPLSTRNLIGLEEIWALHGLSGSKTARNRQLHYSTKKTQTHVDTISQFNRDPVSRST